MSSGPGDYHEGRLAAVDARGDQPADLRARQRLRDADQRRPPDSVAVRDRRLLRLSAGAGSRQPGAGRDDRPARRERRPRPDAAHRRARRPRGRAAAAAGRRGRDDCIRGSSTSGRRARIRIGRSWACRSSIAACSRACWSSRPSSRGSSAPTTVRMLVMAGDPARADRQRGAHARPVRRAGAPAAVRAGAEPLVELGHGHHQPVSRAGSGAVARARSQSDRAAAADPDRQARRAGVAARAPQPDQLRLPPHAGVPALDEHLGRAARRRAVGAARRVFLRRVRAARVAADLFRRPRHSRPAITSRARRISAFRSSASACTTTRDTSGSGWTATAGSTRSTSTSTAALLPIQPGRSDGGEPVMVSIETRTGTIFARVWQLSVGRNTLLLLDSNVEGNRPEDRELTARLYGGDERVRIRQELLLGVGGVRALSAMGITPGVLHLNEGHSAFAALELVRKRMATEGIDASEALRPRRRAGRLHHAHAGARRPRSVRRRAHRGASRTAPRIARAERRRADGARPRRSGTTATRTSA